MRDFVLAKNKKKKNSRHSFKVIASDQIYSKK